MKLAATIAVFLESHVSLDGWPVKLANMALCRDLGPCWTLMGSLVDWGRLKGCRVSFDGFG